MTSEGLYKEYVARHINNFLESQRRNYEPFRLNSSTQGMNLSELIVYAGDVSENYRLLKDITVDDCHADVLSQIKESFVPDINFHKQEILLLQENEKAELLAIDEDKDKKLLAKNEDILAKRKELLAGMSSVIHKHEVLKSLKPELENVFKIYGMSSTAVQVDYESSSLEELSELIDIATVACRSTVQNSDLFSKATSLLYLPAIKKFSDKDTNTAFSVSWLVSLLILGIFAKPYFFGGVGLLYLISMFGNVHKVKEKEELLYLAYSLTDTLDFEKFVENDPNYLKLVSELEELDMEDLSLKKAEVSEKYKTMLEELEKRNPKLQLDIEERKYIEALEEIDKQCRDAEARVLKELNQIIVRYEMELSSIRKEFEEMKANTVFLGTEIKDSKVLDTNFKLGVGKFEGEIVTEAKMDIPLKNILFTYRNESERDGQIGYMKLLLCNALSNVKEKYMNVTIYDSNGLNKDFSDLYDPALSKIIKFESKNFRKLIEGYTEKVTKNILKFGNASIQEYNTKAAAAGKVTSEYDILIVVSTEENIVGNKAFRELLDYSAEKGLWVWVLQPDETSVDPKERETLMEFYKGLPRSKTPGKIEFDNTLFGQFEDPIEGYTYSYALGAKMVRTMIETLEQNRVDSLDYETAFRQIHIPDDKIWTYSTRKGIELNFGYVDGDPTKPHVITLSDGPVHALGGGTTGSGKSAAVDAMMASLLHKYAPEQLELFMIDLKNASISKYSGSTAIPHAKVLAGTKDGEYMVSIFRYLVEEMERRNKLFAPYKVDNIEAYNNIMERQGRTSEILPRILLHIDEYQAMFLEVADKALESIKKDISTLAKKARSAGIHMFFISQSQEGTMPDDIKDQFTLRMALRGSAEMSQSLLGDRAASTIKEKHGYMYSTTAVGDPAALRFWRIPYANNEYIESYLKKLIHRGKAGGNLDRKAVFYDEDEVHPGSKLTSLLQELPAKLESTGESIDPLFVVGERTSFSENKLPNNFKMLRQDNENAVVSGFERSSVLNMVNTFIENLKVKNCEWCAYSGDRDSTILLDLPNRVPEAYRGIFDDEMPIEQMLEILKEELEYRKSNPDEEHKSLYFLAIHWDKIDGIGRGDNYNFVDYFKPFLMESSKYGIHCIFFVSVFKELSRLKAYFNHKIISYAEENESVAMMDNTKGNKIKSTFAIYTYGSTEFKFKIYDFPLQGKLEKREVVLTY